MAKKNATPASEPPEARASDAVLARLLQLHPKIIDLSLDRMERLLARMDHPEERLPPVVHVAGTNGKGSVIAFLRAMLEAAGRRVHVYTSPHLVRFHERIRLAGELIGEDALLQALEAAEELNGERPITFFEITTALALKAFAETPADVLLLEVGLGGRLDATNVVARPALSVITPVSMDHQQYLGDSLRQIAFEKAGILKAGTPAVVAPQEPQALAAIGQRAAELGVELDLGGRDWRAEPLDGGGFRFLAEGVADAYPRPSLAGPHQIANAATAVACARRLRDFGLDDDVIRAGLGTAVWPARLQRLDGGRLWALLPESWELWLDGGHNAEAGRALGAQAAIWEQADAAPLHVVYGMLNTKAAGDFLLPLARRAASLTAVAIPGEPNSLSAAQAAAAARETGALASTSESVSDALRRLGESAEPGRPARVLICGSLYLAGRVLAENA
jgi:dihydrofolate synthase/folylpolyglutamate synthase